jgi:hypothetical protein
VLYLRECLVSRGLLQMGHFLFFPLRRYGKESLTLGLPLLGERSPRHTVPSGLCVALVLLRELSLLARCVAGRVARVIGLRISGRA